MKSGDLTGLEIPAHPRQLRNVCGFSLADRGVKTRLIQDKNKKKHGNARDIYSMNRIRVDQDICLPSPPRESGAKHFQSPCLPASGIRTYLKKTGWYFYAGSRKSRPLNDTRQH